jgi:large subunit ribosomal protein L1
MAEKKAKRVTDEENAQSIESKLDEIAAKAKPVSPVEKAKLTEKPLAKKTVVKKESKPKRARSKKYLLSKEKIDKDKLYPLAEAIQHLKACSYTSFDGTVELHAKMQTIKKKKDEAVVFRGTVRLPSGSPKERKIVVASEELIEDIKKGKVNFDILLSTPEMMPKLAVVAKILGPKGKMPSPKAGTVTTDPEKTKTELSSGLVEYRTDAHGIIHLAVGKVSWDDEKLKTNIETLLAVLPKRNISSLTIGATMSPGIRLALEK